MKRAPVTSHRPEGPKWPADKPRSTGEPVSDENLAQQPEVPVAEVTSLGVFALRLGWFFMAPMGLLMTLWKMQGAGPALLTGLDIVFAALVALGIGCRWGEQRSGQATTMAGERASWHDFRAYVVTLLAVSITAWLLSKAIVFFW
jgi:hypothetical protein